MKRYSEQEIDAIVAKEKSVQTKKTPRSPTYKPQGRQSGVVAGGVPAIKTMLDTLGFSDAVNAAVHLFKFWQPYSEAEHVLNIGLNPLFGGKTLDQYTL